MGTLIFFIGLFILTGGPLIRHAVYAAATTWLIGSSCMWLMGSSICKKDAPRHRPRPNPRGGRVHVAHGLLMHAYQPHVGTSQVD